MLSVLIPNFNYNAKSLVQELYSQCKKCKIKFEILVFDDGSKSKLNDINETINNIENCTFVALKNNIGRSAMRNLLCLEANYKNLLFVDSGTFPKSDDFINVYISNINNLVTVGGMTCLKNKPKKPYTLRWKYTKNRESINLKKTICSSNFLIQKEIILKYPFDESIKKYGCEDVIFFDRLRKEAIKIIFINNPVIHDAKDDVLTFLKKTEYALDNLYILINQNKIDRNRFEVSKFYFKIKNLKLDNFISYMFKLFRPLLIKSLNSSYPLLFLFDIYRLGYFCTLKIKK